MKRIQHSLHSRKVGVDRNGALVVPNIAIGDAGKQFELASPTRVVHFEDFMGDVAPSDVNYTEGTDTTTADGAIVALVNGVFRLTAGDSAGTIAADGAQLNTELNWKVSAGKLVMEARVSIAAITTVSCFVGLTDTKALEAPFSLSGTTFTSNATDAVGFLFDTAATTDTIRLVGVKADTDATAQDTSVAFVADTYKVLRVEINSDGAATFYINGLQVGTLMSAAITTTVALTPVFIIRPEGAVAGRTMDIDYFMVAADRV
jgi:hypothetical protein